MREAPRIAVTVIRAAPDRTFRVDLALPAGSTVADAIEQSGIRDAMPGIDIQPERVGIFARKVTLDTCLRAGDRVEIYRGLKIGPREARRRRAATHADSGMARP